MWPRRVWRGCKELEMKNIVNRILESCKTIKRSSVLKIVCNALNTADYDKIEGKDCIDYWKEKKPGIKVHICPACNKPLGDEDVVGGHVIDFLSSSPHVYITPLHDACNKRRGDLPFFKVKLGNLVQVPKDDEEKILAMHENIEEIKVKIEEYKRTKTEPTKRLMPKPNPLGNANT